MGTVQMPLDDEHLKAIGSVAASFSLLDDTLSAMIHILTENNGMIGEQRIGKVITAELSFKQKVNLFSSLACHLMGTTREPDDLRSLVGRLTEAEEKRNTILHSVWGAGAVEGAVTRFKSTAKTRGGRSGFRLQAETMVSAEIQKLSDANLELAYDLLVIRGFI